MAVQNQKRVVRSKKSATRRIEKKIGVRYKPKKTVMPKISILEESSLIGCLMGTGITSANYKNISCR